MKSLNFIKHFCDHLPADPDLNNISRQVPNACYSWVEPAKVKKPSLVAYSSKMAELFDLSETDCLSSDFPMIFSGNTPLPGMKPYAMRYAGHQFGNWAGQLGDGRAINLGEVYTKNKELWTLQLKGAGGTPYSRHADGLAVLRSSVREFLCSEAMHHLGVPTTRALSLVLSGEEVMRDMFYDGNPSYEPGAIVCRAAPSFIRFGNFEMHASQGETEILKKLLDYTITYHYPHLGDPNTDTYLQWFDELCERSITMVTHWMRVGFVHGVMNTDNMSALGLTIDYGPYGWLENYDLNWTPNTTDAQGRRYAYGKQPNIVMWNLYQLGNALLTIIDDQQKLQDILEKHGSKTLPNSIDQMLAHKLGFENKKHGINDECIDKLNLVLQYHETDMTLFYRHLAELKLDEDTFDGKRLLTELLPAYYQAEELSEEHQTIIMDWLQHYQHCLKQEGISDSERKTRMNQVNPKYVLRNYLAQLAIDKAEEEKDFSMIHKLLDVLRKPYEHQEGQDEFCQKRPDWAKQRAGCSMLSCSS